MEASIRSLAKRRAGDDSSEDESTAKARKKAEKKARGSALDAERAKYTAKKGGAGGVSGKGKKKGGEEDVMAVLEGFKKRIRSAEGGEAKEGEEEGGVGEDDRVEMGSGWMGGRLTFDKSSKTGGGHSTSGLSLPSFPLVIPRTDNCLLYRIRSPRPQAGSLPRPKARFLPRQQSPSRDLFQRPHQSSNHCSNRWYEIYLIYDVTN